MCHFFIFFATTEENPQFKTCGTFSRVQEPTLTLKLRRNDLEKVKFLFPFYYIETVF